MTRFALIMGCAFTSVAWASELNPARWSEHRTPNHDPSALRAPRARGGLAQTPQLRGQAFMGTGSGGGAVQFDDLDGDGRAEAIQNDGGILRAYRLEGQPLWETPWLNVKRVQALDLDGDGKIELLGSNFDLGAERMLVLNAETGQVLWQRTYPPGIRGYAMEVGAFDPRRSGMQIFLLGSKDNLKRAWWYSFERGVPEPQLDWCVGIPAVLGATGGPTYLMHDVDHDGVIDPVCINHHTILVLDVATGRDKWRVEWDSGGAPRRNYGPCYPADLTGDGRTDFVQFGQSVEKHLSVILNTDDGLKLGWTHWLGYYWNGGDQVQIQAPPGAVADLDGDGRLDVLARLNADGPGPDKGWNLRLYDRVSGEEQLCLTTDQEVRGAADVNADGAVDLFLEDDKIARIVTFEGGAVSELWRQAGARFVAGDRAVWVADVGDDGGNAFAIDVGGELRLLQSRDGQFRQIWASSAVRLLMADNVPRRADYNGDGHAEFLADHAGQLVGYQWRNDNFVRVWPAERENVPIHALIKDVNGDGRVDVIATSGSAYTIRCADGSRIAFTPPSVWAPAVPMLRAGQDDKNRKPAMYAKQSDGQTVRLRLREGRTDLVVELAPIPPALSTPPPYDFDGDGQVDQLIVRPNYVTAVRSDGTELWRQPIPPFHLNPRNVVVGHMLGRKGHDVYVAWFYPESKGREGIGVCLHGETGEIVWQAERISPGFGGPSWFAPPAITCQLWDLNGDGCDDVLLGINTTYAALSGIDGSYVAGPANLYGYWGGVNLLDVDADNVPDLELWTLHAVIGVLNLDGSPRWKQNIPVGAVLHPHCVGNVTGDGRLQTGRVFNDGLLRCLNLYDGEQRWMVRIAAAKPDWLVAADVDGDGDDEFVLLADRTIYCYKEVAPDRGALLWKCDLAEAGFSKAALRDVDGDGRLALVATSFDGRVWVMGAAKLTDDP